MTLGGYFASAGAGELVKIERRIDEVKNRESLKRTFIKICKRLQNGFGNLNSSRKITPSIRPKLHLNRKITLKGYVLLFYLLYCGKNVLTI